MSAERNSSLVFTVCLSVEFEIVKKLKKNGENAVYAMCLPTFLHSMLRTCTFVLYPSNGITIGLRTVTTCFVLRMGCVCYRVLCYFSVVSSSSCASSYVMVFVAYLSPKPRDLCLFLYHKWWDSIINVRVFIQSFLFFTLKNLVSSCKVSHFLHLKK